jgi:hypothetical protein
LRQQRGQHLEALQLLDRAAYINKANQGLYSAEQIALTRQMLTSLRALGDREGILNQLERLVVLNQRHHGRNHSEAALALGELGSWQVEDFIQLLRTNSNNAPQAALSSTDLSDRYAQNSASMEPLYAAQKTFIEAIDLLVKADDFTNPGLFALENDLIETYYLNARRDLVLQNPDFAHRAPKRNVSSLERFERMTTPPADYHHGVNAYHRQLAYLHRGQRVTYGQLSEIALALADWHQLFAQYGAASEQREQLRGWLSTSGLDERQIDSLMLRDSPVVLPTFAQGPLSPREFSPDTTRGHIDLTIRVDQRGAVRDVEQLGLSEGTPDLVVEELVSLVKASRFRSDADDGSINGIRYYYQY